LRRLRAKASERWTSGRNEALLQRYGMTERQAVNRSIAALKRMEKQFRRETVYLNGLDNPYIQEHARRTIMGEAMREKARRRGEIAALKPSRRADLTEAA